MIDQWLVTIPELTGKKHQRRVYAYVPNLASSDPQARFPVLYMFDGHNVFFDEDATYGKSWGLGRYLDAHQVSLMVVAVECSHEPKNGRLSEYAPFSFTAPQIGRVYGRGQKTMNWFVRTLKPDIDARYPTLPQRECTFIGGSSMGGLMTLYALTAYSNVFSRAAALSPSVWTVNRRLLQLVRQTTFPAGTVLYMDYGSREMANHPGVGAQFAALTKLLMDKGVWVTSRIVPNGDHCEACWEEQLPFMISTLMYERY